MKIDLSCKLYRIMIKGHEEGCTCDRDLRKWRKTFMTSLNHPYPVQIPRKVLTATPMKGAKDAQRKK